MYYAHQKQVNGLMVAESKSYLVLCLLTLACIQGYNWPLVCGNYAMSTVYLAGRRWISQYKLLGVPLIF